MLYKDQKPTQFPLSTLFCPYARELKCDNKILDRNGAPFHYYVGSHSIFRFVQGRTWLYMKLTLTDGAGPQ